MPDTAVAGGAAVRPTLLFYCQHSLGIGHLTRSFALAAALHRDFHVVFLNGGRMPPGLLVPAGIEIVDLPPLGMDEGRQLISRDATQGVAETQVRRRALIEAAVLRNRPAVVLVELFPFGRKKFAAEILTMIRLARRQSGAAVRVACSLRDILVDARRDQQRFDDRARWLADRYFDLVLVHADPKLARLEETFRPAKPLRVPVRYTGYVVPHRAQAAVISRGEHLLVSAGGGIVGDSLFRTALQARALLRRPWPMRIIAGPFLPELQWQALQQMAQSSTGVELVRHVPDMVAEMRRARASISQYGYNTALDIVVSGVPALVVPYATASENEQSQRAQRMAALGALRHLPAAGLNPRTLADAIEKMAGFEPRKAVLQMDGAAQSAQHLRRLCAPSMAEPVCATV